MFVFLNHINKKIKLFFIYIKNILPESTGKFVYMLKTFNVDLVQFTLFVKQFIPLELLYLGHRSQYKKVYFILTNKS